MSRNTPPPMPPPKDQSQYTYYNNNTGRTTTTSRHSSYNNNNNNPNDLAEAIRDTVHISGKSSSNSLRTAARQDRQQRSYSPSQLNQAQTHSYTRSSPDMSSHMTQQQHQHQQPMLPSAMATASNPFEEDEIEPERRKGGAAAGGGAAAQPSRQKISRATTS